MKPKASRIFLASLLTAGAAVFVLGVMRRRKEDKPAVTPSYARPEGGEREGEFELFIGS